jgi:hypothetical protein
LPLDLALGHPHPLSYLLVGYFVLFAKFDELGKPGLLPPSCTA